ncbi:MAG: nucleotide exchange factor GrpE [Planctomycetaceae bacterium]|jgi:molecular chaperone GrpE|nr:nucleotide exchange factor GrpE [Planctomycetaceae bacterium]
MSETEPTSEATETPEAERLRAERDDLLTQLARARADYQNLRKRTQVDIDNSVRRSLEGLLSGILVIVDHLDFALASPVESDDGKALAKGVELTRLQLQQVLAQENVQPIADTLAFDPNLHEAVSMVESSERKPGEIVATLRRGWTWRGQVLRAAQVQVAKAAPASTPPPADGAAN